SASGSLPNTLTSSAIFAESAPCLCWPSLPTPSAVAASRTARRLIDPIASVTTAATLCGAADGAGVGDAAGADRACGSAGFRVETGDVRLFLFGTVIEAIAFADVSLRTAVRMTFDVSGVALDASRFGAAGATAAT